MGDQKIARNFGGNQASGTSVFKIGCLVADKILYLNIDSLPKKRLWKMMVHYCVVSDSIHTPHGGSLEIPGSEGVQRPKFNQGLWGKKSNIFPVIQEHSPR